jgi:hypothetical protein
MISSRSKKIDFDRFDRFDKKTRAALTLRKQRDFLHWKGKIFQDRALGRMGST